MTQFTDFPTQLSTYLHYDSEPAFTREEITLLANSGTLKGGTLLGKITKDTANITSAAGAGNTGDGAMGAVTAGPGIKRGDYTVVLIEPATDGGVFEVVDPDGIVVGTGSVGSAFNGPIVFTLADGATDFVAGDIFTITVPEGSGKYAPVDLTQKDGRETAAAVLLQDCTVPAAADRQEAALVRGPAIFRGGGLTYPDGATADQKTALHAQLAALHMLVK